jgi:putative PIN family toxin of toxin-antitoxin system
MKSEKKSVVLDTNIIISAAISKEGMPANIFYDLIRSRIINYTTKEIIEELLRVFDKPSLKDIIDYNRKKFVLRGYISKSVIIKPEFDEKVIIEDPSDDKFINCALTSKSNIVSGDSHLLKLRKYKGVKIMSAKEFLESLKRGN